MKKILLLVSVTLFLLPGLGWADYQDQKDSPEVGKKAADKYFLKRQKRSQSTSRGPSSSGSGSPRYMALQLGTFVSEDTYKWGEGENNEPGKLIGGVTYRVGEWQDSMDLFFRADLSSYDIDDRSAVKLSLMPLIAFPDARSNFPIYFGGGIGLGVFFKQAPGESDLSLDYQVVAGGRFFDVFDNIGLTFEVGVKNHIFLLSDGQYNGVFVSAGTVFNF